MSTISTFRFANIAMLVVVAVIGIPATAHAHVGVGPAHDLLDGLVHPLTGLDHICAMLAVGIWAGQCGGRAIWLVPLSFLSAMALGGMLATAGVKLSFVEPGIALSLVVLGLLVAVAIRLPLAASMAIVALFALVHGYSHGLAIPAAASGVTYAAGFILTTAVLNAAGVVFGLSMQRLHSSQFARLAGAAITVSGVYIGIG